MLEFPFAETEMLRLLDEKNVPGISIAIIENAEIASHHEFGIKDEDSLEPVNRQTVFEAASLSKPVFTYAVLQLVEEGQFNLDSPLADILPHPNPDIENSHWLRRYVW